MSPLLAGAAVADITPAAPVLMDGYGGRTKPSQGVHDPLSARALVLDDGSTACAIVSTDLLGVHPWLTAELRRRVAEGSPIPPENVLLSATHNHAGPYGLRGGMFSRLDQPLAEETVDRMAQAVLSAFEGRRPASLKLGQAGVETVSMNRRHPYWPIDAVMRLLLVDGEDGAAPVASVLNFACHATIMSGSNLLLSGEFPAAACRLLLEHTGAPCVYLNGACGNVNPVWIKQDFESVERTGQIIGGQALRIIGELRSIGPGQRAHNIRWDEYPEKPVPGRVLESRLRVAAREVELPLRPFRPDEEYEAETQRLQAESAGLEPATEALRDVMARLTRAQAERWAAAWARSQAEEPAQRTVVQAIRLGEGAAVLALPGEFFVETGAVIRAACGLPDLFLACYANDYVGYVIPAEAYGQGGYEAGVAFCGPDAEGIVVKAAVELLREVSS